MIGWFSGRNTTVEGHDEQSYLVQDSQKVQQGTVPERNRQGTRHGTQDYPSMPHQTQPGNALLIPKAAPTPVKSHLSLTTTMVLRAFPSGKEKTSQPKVSKAPTLCKTLFIATKNT